MRAKVDVDTKTMILELPWEIWSDLPDAEAELAYLSRRQDHVLRHVLGGIWHAEGLEELLANPQRVSHRRE